MDQYEVRQWFDYWRQCIELADNEMSSSLYDELVGPFKKADPVYSAFMAKELVGSPYAEQITQILSSLSHSKKRIMVCDLLFNVSKCTSRECRLLVASQFPVLIWMEWTLDRANETVESDLVAIEVTLLAAFQQDLNIEPAPPQIRVPDIKTQSSIYHGSLSDGPDTFPYSLGEPRVIHPDPSMYPARLVTKIDDYSRPIVIYRLSRFLQDNMTSLPAATKLCYCALIERLASTGTKLFDPERLAACLKNLKLEPEEEGMLSLLRYEHQNNASLASSSSPNHGLQMSDSDPSTISALFDTARLGAAPRRFPACVPLYLVWAHSLATLAYAHPKLVQMVQKQLLRRARYESLPLVVLALS